MQCILLAEDYNYPFGSFLEAVKEKFPKNAYIYVGGRDVENIVGRVSTPPLMSNSWLIVVSIERNLSSAIFSLNFERDVIVAVVRNRGMLSKTYEFFKKNDVNPQVVDNLDPPIEIVIDYITNNLNITEDNAKYLYNRVGKSIARLLEAIQVLSLYPKNSRKVISSVIEKRNTLPLSDLFEYLINQSKPSYSNLPYTIEINRKKVYAKLGEFNSRGGTKFLFKYFKTCFEVYLKVFEDADRGLVALDNYEEYAKSSANTWEVSSYFIRRAVEAVGDVPFETLYHLNLLLEETAAMPRSFSNLLVFFRLGRG
jgi:hypothetical protein